MDKKFKKDIFDLELKIKISKDEEEIKKYKIKLKNLMKEYSLYLLETKRKEVKSR